ncbi:MAG TPA: ABC transporter permease [Actinophytocola sp.]|uniref:ABC transporter permease n=1 Tax=Actinophytocola sp. TaxID=1872138 RepID=UPI002DB59E9F|nr:ABC transporter permease [Actinophytocola sp.]HEU5475726.1 ABC transporter permease [Actinophytocola sp.]
MTGSDVRLGTWQAVQLVASREVTTRLRSKAFIWSLVVTLLLLIGFALTMKLVDGGADATVGVTGQTAALQGPLTATGAALEQDIEIRTVPDEAAGRAQVADDSLDALLIGDGQRIQVVVKKELDGSLRNALNVLAGQLVLNQAIERLGGDPAAVGQAVAGAGIDVESLEPPFPYEQQQLVLGIIAGILIYMALLLNGTTVATGVVEEKSSRVVELLLATIRPWQLMAGKVAGIGLVGLIQIVVIGVVGVVAALAIGALTISASAAFGTVVWLIVWFLLGFVMYSLVFAALAALVSRQEDVQGVITPPMMVVVLGYVLGISILPSDPDNKLCEVLSVIPFFAPTMMPMRLAMGGVPGWQAALSVVLVVLTIPALVWLSGRIYRNAVVRSGARVKLSDALRPA